MSRIRVVVVAVMLVGVVGWMLPAAHAKKKKKNQPPEELVTLVDRVTTGRSNFFLRNAFDTDPSPYFGRFIPSGEASVDVDDAAAMQTSCSEFISYKYIGGGGVVYDDYFNASTEVSVGLGVPLLSSQMASLGAEVGYSGGSVVRVQYELVGKMVATIDDPDAFAECCEEGPSRCTGLYLGEFLEGKGEVYHISGNATGVKVGVGVKGVEADVNVKDGVSWNRSIQFPNPVYFAFKTTTVPPGLVQEFEECGDWQTRIPESGRGQYFVGLSDIVESERMARDQARKDARVQVVQYLGDAIQAGSIELRSTSGGLGELSTKLQSEDFIQSAATGVAELVKDRAWCIEEHETPGGIRFEAKALSYLPDKETENVIDVIDPPAEEPETPTKGSK